MQPSAGNVDSSGWIRRVHLVLLLGVANGAVIWAAANGQDLLVVAVLLAAVAWTFVAERAAPYDPSWNRDHGDSKRDVAYAAMNESLNAASVAVLPLLAGHLTLVDLWPSDWPFLVQVAVAVLVLDAGVTFAHMASHHIGWLWRFHAVHHSVTRFYGLNGLMKHPVHQAIEMTAGVAPLILVGLPQPVAIAVAGCVVIQLLVQHANVDYASGPLAKWLAVNTGHRLHHLRYAGQGDVNFGLFTLVWDRLLGTYHPADPEPPITTDDLGITDRPDYPTGFADQLVEPFRPKPVVPMQ